LLTSRRLALPPLSFLPWVLPPLFLSYDAVGADGGSVRHGRFAEEAASGHEGEGGKVLAVKAVQEKTSVFVAQGTEEIEAAAVENRRRRWRRRGTTPSMQELKTHAAEKKKWPNIEVVQKAEMASVESMRMENATLHSIVKKKDTVVVISQKKEASRKSRTR
jgi:hypothetical protein